MTPLWHSSPNFGERRDGLRPELIVLHYTAMNTAQAAIDRLCDPEFEVSAHYVVSEKGVVTQLVEEAARAWHAGAGSWAGRDDINSRSIGIEIANPGTCPFSAPQMDAVEDLIGQIMGRWDIRPEGVIGHSDLAPLRKCDPGRRFDWRRLARGGLAVWPKPAERTPLGFQEAAEAFGYPKVALGPLLEAFRQRFRPHAKGPLDDVDVALANDLATRFPVDQQAAIA